MNDLNSILMATLALAIGGLGLYWYKNSDSIFSEDDNDENNDYYNEDNYEDNSEYDSDDNSQEDENLYNKKREKKIVKKSTINTKRNMKKSSGTKRRY